MKFVTKTELIFNLCSLYFPIIPLGVQNRDISVKSSSFSFYAQNRTHTIKVPFSFTVYSIPSTNFNPYIDVIIDYTCSYVSKMYFVTHQMKTC